MKDEKNDALKKEKPDVNDAEKNLKQIKDEISSIEKRLCELKKEKHDKEDNLTKLKNEQDPDQFKKNQTKIIKLEGEIAALTSQIGTEENSLSRKKEEKTAAEIARETAKKNANTLENKKNPQKEESQSLQPNSATESEKAENRTEQPQNEKKTFEDAPIDYRPLAAMYFDRIGTTVHHWAFGPVKIVGVDMRKEHHSDDSDTTSPAKFTGKNAHNTENIPWVVCKVLDEEGIVFPMKRLEKRAIGLNADGLLRFPVTTAEYYLMSSEQYATGCAECLPSLVHKAYQKYRQ